jgi:hypothetical protein
LSIHNNVATCWDLQIVWIEIRLVVMSIVAFFLLWSMCACVCEVCTCHFPTVSGFWLFNNWTDLYLDLDPNPGNLAFTFTFALSLIVYLTFIIYRITFAGIESYNLLLVGIH